MKMPQNNRNDLTILIDYAHTSDALHNVLTMLRSLNPKRLITVFGCGGDRDRGKRPLMAEAATGLSDYSVLTSDNPRTEDPEQIINDTRKGISNGANHKIIEDRGDAINHIIKKAKEGDVILLAGKGAEEYQEVNGERMPFSDRAVAVAQARKIEPSTSMFHLGEKK